MKGFFLLFFFGFDMNSRALSLPPSSLTHYSPLLWERGLVSRHPRARARARGIANHGDVRAHEDEKSQLYFLFHLHLQRRDFLKGSCHLRFCRTWSS